MKQNKMSIKKGIIIVILLFTLLAVACFLTGCTDAEETNDWFTPPDVSVEEDTPVILPELQRFRVQIVEDMGDGDYIVSKYSYAIGGVYHLSSTNEHLDLGDLVYIILLDDYNCRLFSEWIQDEDGFLIRIKEIEYYLLVVVDRRDADDGYEYQLREYDDETFSTTWYYSDVFLSIDEYAIGIEYGTEVILFDLS